VNGSSGVSNLCCKRYANVTPSTRKIPNEPLLPLPAPIDVAGEPITRNTTVEIVPEPVTPVQAITVGGRNDGSNRCGCSDIIHLRLHISPYANYGGRVARSGISPRELHQLLLSLDDATRSRRGRE
jgi:hypothetical protein